jgi:hypothetical protein
VSAPRRQAAISGDWTFTDARYRSLAASTEDGGGDPVVLDGLRVYNTSSYVGVTALDLAPAAASWRLTMDRGLLWRIEEADPLRGTFA